MSNLGAARAQMGASLAFHIIFAVLGMGLPLLLVIAEGLWLRTGTPVYLALAKRWAQGLGILFAVGAVSGTILSFELGLLWPTFMQFAGSIIGMPFSAEGFAFFIEAIFLAISLYGWERVSPRLHWLCSLPVAVAGALSAIFVVSANAWMNSPSGFRIVQGKVTDVDPVAAMFNGAWGQPWCVYHRFLPRRRAEAAVPRESLPCQPSSPSRRCSSAATCRSGSCTHAFRWRRSTVTRAGNGASPASAVASTRWN